MKEATVSYMNIGKDCCELLAIISQICSRHGKAPPDPFFKTEIRAQMATAAPPLGPELGQRGLNVANFCKDFNKNTAHIKAGTTLPVEIRVKPDRTYDLELREKQTPDELNEVKGQSARWCPMQDICQMLIKECQRIGIHVQREDLDPAELKAFLDKRREIVAAQLKEIEEKEAAKMLRGS
uniref:Large ribosomal subunit protein uL11m n=1 Tax=Ditylenchus dipsaci TaxID=166011 RepID=A0A915CNA2_9BILA